MNILLRSHGGLGDELCFTPGIRELVRVGHNVYLECLYPDLFKNNPNVSTNAINIDKVIDMKWHNELGSGYDMHLTDYFAIQMGVKLEDRSLEIYPTDENFQFARECIDGLQRPLIMYNTFHGWPAKGSLTRDILIELDKIGGSLVMIGNRPPWTGIGYNLVGHTDDILNTAALLSICDLYVGNESGLAHVAGAVGCRSIILYTSTYYECYRHDRQIPIYCDECNGCYNKLANIDIVKNICPRGDFICMKYSSKVNDVLEAVRRLVDED